jgi:hypothetical protein
MKRAAGLLLSCLCFALIAVADLHDTDNSADYLIISSSDVIQQNGWIQNLADWRDDHGRVSMIVSTEEIFDEFGDGTPSDTTLKEFLHFARLSWTPPQLQYVFFIGHHDIVPSHIQQDSRPEPQTYFSDYFYATEIETEDYLPVLSIGRFPWSPTFNESLPDYYSKIIAYETAPEADWQRRVHFVTDSVEEGLLSVDWEEFAEGLIGDLPLFYQGIRDFMGASQDNPNFANLDTILQNWNEGNYLFSYVGRGSGCLWSEVYQIDSADLGDLNNQSRLPIIIPYCAGREFEMSEDSLFTGCIPYNLLSNPNGGAIGYIAKSNIGWMGASSLYIHQAISAATDDSVATMGEMWRHGLEDLISSTGSQIIGTSIGQTVFGSILFGDPALRLPDRTTAADENPNPELPSSIALLGNYPNPFNSITTIKYTVPSAARISLAIYNVEGREVETLVDNIVNAGEHTVRWNASAQASGIYFAMLRSGVVTKTAKLVYLK